MKHLYSETESRNPHHLDEMPKNQPSKYIQVRFGRDKLTWLQQHCTTWSHRPVKNAHPRISGIVRQKVNEEIRREIEDEIQTEYTVFGKKFE